MIGVPGDHEQAEPGGAGIERGRSRPGGLTAVAVALALIAACTPRPPVAVIDRTVVAASIAPVADIAARVGGEHIRVTTLVPQGIDPRAFVPSGETPLAGVDVLLVDGRDFEASLAIDHDELPEDALVVALGEVAVTEDERFATAEAGAIPGVWLTPSGARAYATVIRDTLARVDAVHIEDFQAGADALVADLDALEAALADLAGTIPAGAGPIATMLDHVVYPAAVLGLAVRHVPAPADPSEPTDEELRAAIKAARAAGASALVVPAGLPRAAERRLGRTGLTVAGPVRLTALPGAIGSRDGGIVALQARNAALLGGALGADVAALEPFLT